MPKSRQTAPAKREPIRAPQTNEEVIHAGKEAARILGDDTFRYAVQAAEELFVREWRTAETPERREMAWAKTHALDEVLRMLRSIMDHGEITAARVNRDSR